MKKKEILKEVTDTLYNLGISPKLAGYKYIIEATMLSYYDNSYINNLTTKLYPKIGEKYNTTPSRIERDIRYSVEKAWKNGDINLINDMGKYITSFKTGRPCNSDFIAILVDRLKTQN